MYVIVLKNPTPTVAIVATVENLPMDTYEVIDASDSERKIRDNRDLQTQLQTIFNDVLFSYGIVLKYPTQMNEAENASVN